MNYLDRLEAMVAPGQATWDLSEKDVSAIRFGIDAARRIADGEEHNTAQCNDERDKLKGEVKRLRERDKSGVSPEDWEQLNVLDSLRDENQRLREDVRRLRNENVSAWSAQKREYELGFRDGTQQGEQMRELLEMVLLNEGRASRVSALDLYRHVCANIRAQIDTTTKAETDDFDVAASLKRHLK